MKYILRNILLLLLISPTAKAQDFSAILKSIEQHSTTLEAARLEAEAEKADIKVNTALDAPEAEVGYLWGNNGIGHRIDIDVSQSFDFPTVYAQRSKMAKEQRRVADLKYLTERQQLLITAHKLCLEVVYCNALMNHLKIDLNETRSMAQAYQTLFDKGEATAIDRNKAHQSVVLFEAEYREVETMHNNLLEELKNLNGGEAVVINDSTFTHTPLPSDFNAWLSENIDRYPQIQLAKGQISANEKALKTAKNEWLPKWSVGYRSEKEKVDHYQGATVGISLPVWSGSRKVKAAKAHLAATQLAEKDTRNRLETELHSVFNDALQLQDTYLSYQQNLTQNDNSQNLIKSLNAGQINLLTYLTERQYVHEIHEKVLEAERDLELRKAELTVYE